ncbi:TadE family protein [Brevibacterium ihuae]|uniref:TadE family protein n=1 Tax=Brevibacterium ihuae TaxID=1631743 RepID=UPI000C77C730|nr:TadE family protein [Brevibacterium ihuae]
MIRTSPPRTRRTAHRCGRALRDRPSARRSVIRRARELGRGDRGASAIELAFLGPVLIVIIFFSIQAGLYFYGRNIAVQAAREGLSQLRLFPDAESYAAGSPAVLEYTETFAQRLGGESLMGPEVVSDYDAETGEVTVQVTGTVITLVPGLDLRATGEASGQIERFESDTGAAP